MSKKYLDDLIAKQAVKTVNSLHEDEDVKGAAAAKAAAAAAEAKRQMDEEDARYEWLARLKADTPPKKPADPVTKPDAGTKPGAVTGGAGSSPAAAAAAEPLPQSAYERALRAAQDAGEGAPVYSGSFDEQIRQLYDKILNREDFSYDLNGDAFYRQYKDKYTQAARAAMKDTMGQAAALTGGYGSSYGQAVGQQAYDRKMEGLTEAVPELYQSAYQRYSAEGDRLMQQYALLGQRQESEYSRYRDELGDWERERAYQDAQEKDNLAMLQSLMALGYTPTAEEIAAAGLTQAQYEAIAAQYAPKSGGRSVENSEYDNAQGLTSKQIAQIQAALGVTADGVWGPETEAAYNKAVAKGRNTQYAQNMATQVAAEDAREEWLAKLRK